jgi:hypothetical protein
MRIRFGQGKACRDLCSDKSLDRVWAEQLRILQAEYRRRQKAKTRH